MSRLDRLAPGAITAVTADSDSSRWLADGCSVERRSGWSYTRGAMTLVEGVHHVTFLTEDLDRLTAFDGRVFDATKTLDITEEGVRHVFLEIGSTTVLHPSRSSRALL
jgi:hypothetical protein